MELRHVTSFLAIAEELHFGRAAARMHLAQPSLSQHLQRLERDLGVKLVARNSRDVRLTRAGEAFEIHARTLVTQVRKATEAAREAAAGRSGRIDVGFNFLAGQSILPPVLAEMQSRCPDIEVALTEKRTGPQLTALGAGDLDVALVYGSPATAEFACRRLLRVPLVAVVGQSHKWAGRPRISFGELAQEPCILFDREQCPAMYDALFSSAARSGITLNVADKVDDPGATSITVCVRPVVGFASAQRGTHAGSAGSGIRPVAVPLCDPVPTIDLYTVWRADETAPQVEAFLECLEAAGPFEAPTPSARPTAAEKADRGST
jgi:DNA-binding transcriptional LysR family regulator